MGLPVSVIDWNWMLHLSISMEMYLGCCRAFPVYLCVGLPLQLRWGQVQVPPLPILPLSPATSRGVNIDGQDN